MSASAGVSHLFVPETGRSITGPAYAASLSHQAGRVSLSAGYDESYVATYTFASAMKHRSLGASANVPLNRGRMFINGGFTYRTSDPAIDVVTGGIALDSKVASLSFGINGARWLRTEVFYTGTFQESSARGIYNRSRIGVQFITFKPVRIQ